MSHPLAKHRMPGVTDHPVVEFYGLPGATVTSLRRDVNDENGMDRLSLRLERDGEDLGWVGIYATRLHLELEEDE